MDAGEGSLPSLIEQKVQEAVRSNNSDLLDGIGAIMCKTGTRPAHALDAHTSKRGSDEEQYKTNTMVTARLEAAESVLETGNTTSAKEAIAQGIRIQVLFMYLYSYMSRLKVGRSIMRVSLFCTGFSLIFCKP